MHFQFWNVVCRILHKCTNFVLKYRSVALLDRLMTSLTLDTSETKSRDRSERSEDLSSVTHMQTCVWCITVCSCHVLYSNFEALDWSCPDWLHVVKARVEIFELLLVLIGQTKINSVFFGDWYYVSDANVDFTSPLSSALMHLPSTINRRGLPAYTYNEINSRVWESVMGR